MSSSYRIHPLEDMEVDKAGTPPRPPPKLHSGQPLLNATKSVPPAGQPSNAPKSVRPAGQLSNVPKSVPLAVQPQLNISKSVLPPGQPLSNIPTSGLPAEQQPSNVAKYKQQLDDTPTPQPASTSSVRVRVQEADFSATYRMEMEKAHAQLRQEQEKAKRDREELIAMVREERDRAHLEQEAWKREMAESRNHMSEMMKFIKTRQEAENAAAAQMQAVKSALVEAEARRERELAELEAKRQSELAQLMAKITGSLSTGTSAPRGEPESAETEASPAGSGYQLTKKELRNLHHNGRKKKGIWQTLHALNSGSALEEALEDVLEQFTSASPGSSQTVNYRPQRTPWRKRASALTETKEEYNKLKEKNPEAHKDYLDLCREAVCKSFDIKTDSDIALRPRADPLAVDAYNDGGPNSPDANNLYVDMRAAVKDSRWNQWLVEILIDKAHDLCQQVDHLRAGWWSVLPKHDRDGVKTQDEHRTRLQDKYGGIHKKVRVNTRRCGVHAFHHMVGIPVPRKASKQDRGRKHHFGLCHQGQVLSSEFITYGRTYEYLTLSTAACSTIV
ncbi:hypothetical protein GLOTRDRAFT_93348 [Gloeophyllum trabeum ATCC 11539]|uniref:Uncharacterized protein n=1 Tax=Gloeophyllum trabeum (strain ATCC 11539 / FP-39264 / Madison 617) TaxID=670483 RepID=S7RS04_GLOTA|nr:uncharacterized protein GLOTRDRAFT_93348 [Gloeophyllum trabeum ATCC 11539]EPQ55799.1 hypothetical protein GLOTRDRAFT_93348 [Gloeophyllum trabeum ATCC 11539]